MSDDPDVTLSLDPSATSFLDGDLVDPSGRAIYTIETADALTKLSSVHSSRSRRHSANSTSSVVASIRWPSRLEPSNGRRSSPVIAPDAMVSVHGNTIPSGRLLRPRKLVTDGKSHKFRIDGYKPTFRWKRTGKYYTLFATGHKRPIAKLTSDHLTATYRLQVTGTTLASYHSQDGHGAVSSVLLDHIVLTSLLLVTLLSNGVASQFEEPAAFIYTPSSHPRNPFLDGAQCRPSYFVGGLPTMAPPPPHLFATEERDNSLELRRQASTTSSASSRTLVQSLVHRVLASVSSNDSRLFPSSSTGNLPHSYGGSTSSLRSSIPARY
ncbi:SubName: Full=Uncharacterized protein {ECO:0000313/EMBL:CCA75935.1} [Serendipita indica DSM 11827]|nr:SubName: Full=Uncharacterized protein {ECO:0000313/EMBL:CCA75935.1} [Serendipita indica DSM 11827]